MSDRAALYTVALRSRTHPLPLGDLGDVLAGILDGFAETSGARVVRVLEVERDGDELFSVVQHGARGVAADIVDDAGAVRLRQLPGDVQLVRAGCLFRLPAAETSGRLAVHVANGRGVKELFGQGLAARLRALRPGHAGDRASGAARGAASGGRGGPSRAAAAGCGAVDLRRRSLDLERPGARAARGLVAGRASPGADRAAPPRRQGGAARDPSLRRADVRPRERRRSARRREPPPLRPRPAGVGPARNTAARGNRPRRGGRANRREPARRAPRGGRRLTLRMLASVKAGFWTCGTTSALQHTGCGSPAEVTRAHAAPRPA